MSNRHTRFCNRLHPMEVHVVFIPSTTQLEQLTSRPKPPPMYDEADFTRSSHARWWLVRSASGGDPGPAGQTAPLPDELLRTRGRSERPTEAGARLARRPR